MVAVANEAAVRFSLDLPAIHGGHEAWRYTLISGLLPAIPLIIIRPFLPESPVWQRKKLAGELRRPSLLDIFSPELRRTTLISAVVFASCYGMAFGAIQHLPQIVPGLADVKAQAKAHQQTVVEQAEKEGKALAPRELVAAGKRIEEERAAEVQKWQEVGGLLGRVALAFLAVRIVSRRALLRVFHIPALLYVSGGLDPTWPPRETCRSPSSAPLSPASSSSRPSAFGGIICLALIPCTSEERVRALRPISEAEYWERRRRGSLSRSQLLSHPALLALP
jgi:hypothetical protein